VQITAQSLKQKMKPDQIRSAAEELFQMTKVLFPKYRISPVYLYGEGKFPAGWFLMEMTDMETEHIKTVSIVKEHAILLAFTYPVKESMRWRSTI